MGNLKDFVIFCKNGEQPSSGIFEKVNSLDKIGGIVLRMDGGLNFERIRIGHGVVEDCTYSVKRGIYQKAGLYYGSSPTLLISSARFKIPSPLVEPDEIKITEKEIEGGNVYVFSPAGK